MGHIEEMSGEQRIEFITMQYNRRLEEMRGHNYQYYTDALGKELEDKGYSFYDFQNTVGERFSTNSEIIAKDKVKELREAGNYARIICGYDKNIQRIKMYSVVYKKRKKNE